MSLRTRTILAVATLLLVALAIVGAIGRGFSSTTTPASSATAWRATSIAP
jgi:hypothetical protein